MQRTTPPFRADHVGSLLRSAPLKAAREQRALGEITAEAFHEIENLRGAQTRCECLACVVLLSARGPAPCKSQFKSQSLRHHHREQRPA